jgi:prepilin-type N-terminal cleavage/methylation domain-containing protein
MKTNRKALKSRTGFTIVELLTVMSVIAILITLLVPALTLVRDFAKEIQQKAQFHSLEVGVEMFKTEFGSYPESNDNLDPYDGNKDHPDDPTPYCGANKLAEAMVGLDMLGFHPNSDFRSDGQNRRDDGSGMGTTELYDVYHADTDDFTNPLFRESAEENVQARKGPFLDLENANAYTMEDVYGDSLTVGFYVKSLVLCDEYVAKREGAKKTGMPILYYRARKIYTQQDSEDTDEIVDDIYYYPDNQNLLELGLPEDDTLDHPLSDGLPGGLTGDYKDFDNMIINTQITQIQRPYRADSYILISAGKDGLYGSPDDLYNFDKE